MKLQEAVDDPVRDRGGRSVSGSCVLARAVLLVAIPFGTGCSYADREADDGRIVISGDPSCAECRIVLEELVTLGSLEDPASIASGNAHTACIVGRLSTGEYVSSGIAGGGEIFVYDQLGTLVGRRGRRGEGPGELGQNLSVIVGPADTLFVVDRSQDRLTTLGPSGNYVASFTLPPRVFGFARLADGGFIFHTRAHGIRGGDNPLLRRYSGSGQELAARQLPSRRMVRQRMADMDRRTVGPSRTGDYWAARYWTYEIQRWTTAGRPDLTIVRDVDWFPPGDPGSADDVRAWFQEAPPPNILRHLWEAEDGLLWTYSIVADPRWTPEPESDAEYLAWSRRTWDTMVEVLDIRNGTVLASLRHDEHLLPVCSSDLVSTVRESPTGDAQAVVFRASLEGL